MPSRQQLKQLQRALIGAFPSRSLLERLLYFELEKNLNEISRESDLQDIVFNIIQTAEAQGWLINLVQAACKENSGNSELAAIALELLPPPASTVHQKILVLADASLNENTQKIESVIKKAVKLDLFEVKVRTVVSPQDIRKALVEEHPFIVHFCAQSTKDGNLVLKDCQGNDKYVEREVLAELFKLYAHDVKCVLVNTCYSLQSAWAISKHINYVISLEQSIQEKSVIVFAEGFYNGLGYSDINNSSVISRAFNEGLIALKLDSLKGMMPDLWNQGVLQGEDLSSDRAIDYTRVRNLLKAGNWKDADYETYLLMLKVVGRSQDDWIREEELLNFPCTDLRTIDRLWVKYSSGRFGFSVQKKIYLEVGGKPDGKYYPEAWDKFDHHVGWKVQKDWIKYCYVTFNTMAPVGHLPTPLPKHTTWRNPVWQSHLIFLRIQACKF